MKRTAIMLPEVLDARLRHDLASMSASGRMGFFGVGDGEPEDSSNG